ncbi:unnamed protein product, partial [Vitis vinifera]
MNDLMTKSFLSYVELKKQAEMDLEAEAEADIEIGKLKPKDEENLSQISEAYREGSPVDRTRISVTNGLRSKLRDMMNDFNSLRERILWDHRETLKRRYYNATGSEASEEVVEKMMTGSSQGEKMDDIEENVAIAGNFISGGTNSLVYAKQMKKGKKWVYWVWAVGLIILLVCFISMLTS